jgi:putative membrane protein
VVKPRLADFVDQKRVREAILRAEQTTTAPITVSIVPNFKGEIRRAAHRELRRRGLTKAPARNAVHFLVVPARREFAIVGDAGAHAALGQSAWDSVASTVAEHFKRGDPTGGLVAGIDQVGAHLARHFPRT